MSLVSFMSLFRSILEEILESLLPSGAMIGKHAARRFFLNGAGKAHKVHKAHSGPAAADSDGESTGPLLAVHKLRVELGEPSDRTAVTVEDVIKRSSGSMRGGWCRTMATSRRAARSSRARLG